MWSVASAKAHLSEILRLARSGEAQTIGAQDPCVIVALSDYHKMQAIDERGHDGDWLVKAASMVGADIPLPSRADDRPDPIFQD